MRVWIAVAAIGLGTVARAECNIDEAGVGERHEALAEERGELTLPARSSLTALRDAAEKLDRNGHAAVCDKIVGMALQLLEDESVWTEEAAAPEQTGKMNLVTFAATEDPVESGALAGKPLRGHRGGLIGIVDGVLLNQTEDASHLIVRRDGFWDDAAEIAVPSERILVEPGTGDLFAEITADRLAEAPPYDRAAWDSAANDPWYDAEAAKAVDEAEAEAMAARLAEQQASDEAMSGRSANGDEPSATPEEAGTKEARRGPKRIRVGKDQPETAEGSND